MFHIKVMQTRSINQNYERFISRNGNEEKPILIEIYDCQRMRCVY